MSVPITRILVTGASSGLGAHFARSLAADGARVALAARRRDRLEAICAEITAVGGVAAAVTMDVGDRASVEAGVRAAEAAIGPLDGLVNNAGVAAGGPTLDVTETEWRRVLDANLDGVFRVAQCVARSMAGRFDGQLANGASGAAIVNVASILGLRVQAGLAAYCASKAAVDHLTRALALEWARYGIRVNALAPGYVPTEMNSAFLASEAGQATKRSIPMRRFGRPEDLDAPLRLLLGAGGAYVTGVTIPVDGGHMVSPL